MKKLITILALLIASNLLFSQEIIRPASAYYSADNVRQRTDVTRAILDGVQIWKDSGFVEMEIPLYQPMLKMRFPKIDLVAQKMVYYKDTVERFDAVVYKDINKSAYGGWFNLRKHYERYGSDEYLVNIEELPNQPTRYVHDSIVSQDANQVTRQYFFTKFWQWSERQHNNLDSLRVMPFTEFNKVAIPGAPILFGDSVRRHTKMFTKKYFQVRAKDTTFNTIDTLSIYGNPLMKLP